MLGPFQIDYCEGTAEQDICLLCTVSQSSMYDGPNIEREFPSAQQ